MKSHIYYLSRYIHLNPLEYTPNIEKPILHIQITSANENFVVKAGCNPQFLIQSSN